VATFNYPKRENNSMGTTKGTSQCVTQLGTFANTGREQKGEQLGTYANMGTEQKGNNWELLQTWEQSNKGTIGNFCKHGNRAERQQLGTFANTGAEQQGNNWERLQTWEQSNKGTCPLASASAREERERERDTVKTTKRSLREFGVLSRKFGGRHRPLFFFLFLFFVFFFSSSWFSCGLRAVCCTVSVYVFVCLCVFLWRGRYFEFVILALLFPQCLCCCRLHVF
jgi:hypothetical protein